MGCYPNIYVKMEDYMAIAQVANMKKLKVLVFFFHSSGRFTEMANQ